MGMFQPDNGPLVVERRASRRTRATCPAILQTLNGESLGQLWDLSETGARIRLADPPAHGTTAKLKWSHEQVMCRVVWTDCDMCGVTFDRPIDRSKVAAVAQMTGFVEKPIASIGNMATGRRRSDRPVASDDLPDQD